MTFTKRVLAPLALTAALVFAGTACSGGSSAASFCDTLKSWKADSKALDGQTGTPGSKEFTDAMKQAKSAVAALQKSAPAEIKGDVATLADAVNTLADLDFSDPKALASAGTKIDNAKIEKATANISTYAKKKCNIDLDAG